jgi:hypothetical protein
MDNSAEYWRRALAAREQARQATNEESRAAWLRIADSFETLFRLCQRKEEVLSKDATTPDPDNSSNLLH